MINGDKNKNNLSTKMAKPKRKLPRIRYWILLITSIVFGMLHFFIWINSISHEGGFEWYFLNLLITSIPIITFFLFIKFKANIKFEEREEKSLKHMGITSLISGVIILFLFSIIYFEPIILRPLSGILGILYYSQIFLMPLLSPLFLIFLGAYLIKLSKTRLKYYIIIPLIIFILLSIIFYFLIID